MPEKDLKPFGILKLPWPKDALEPIISRRTIEHHHGHHHRKYAESLNSLVKDNPLADLSLEEVILRSSSVENQQDVFNNAAQVYNHNLYWESLTPKPTSPSAPLRGMLEEQFGSAREFQEALIEAALDHFGSGWAWLICKDGELSVATTSDAGTPLTDGALCLVCIDVWEHAYYLDYQSNRAGYVRSVVERLLNWNRANKLIGVDAAA